jgi:hypothetical protein
MFMENGGGCADTSNTKKSVERDRRVDRKQRGGAGG